MPARIAASSLAAGPGVPRNRDAPRRKDRIPGESGGTGDEGWTRSPDGRYRRTPLGGLFAHARGGFYHDGRSPTLLDVVNRHDAIQGLGLNMAEKSDLVEYLKSL